MTPDQFEQVFGRSRLKMATGEHVEVFREAVAPGERRRYTKRFLATCDGDFGPWTEREWRILARLIGHGVRSVPDVVQFDGGALGGARLVQTYDAGVTVDQWGTLLPVARDGNVRRHVFEDCAHWWALAHHCLVALDEIHALGLVHLDIKGDNICIPYGPAHFDPDAPEDRLHPEFGRLTLIDFAFSLVSRESLATPLPIGWQKDYDYQSPRLLRALDAGRGGDLEPTRELDWRCDLYSLAAMLKRYLPSDRTREGDGETGWTPQRCNDARTLIFRLRDSHDRDLPHWRPHAQFMDYTAARLDAHDLAASLTGGWTLARETAATGIATPITPVTPMTRIAPAIRSLPPTAITVVRSGRMRAPRDESPAQAPHGLPQAPLRGTRQATSDETPPAASQPTARETRRDTLHRSRRGLPVSMALATLVAIAAPSFIGDPQVSNADVKLNDGQGMNPERVAATTPSPQPEPAPLPASPASEPASTSPPTTPDAADSQSAPPQATPSAVASLRPPPPKRSPQPVTKPAGPPAKIYADATRHPSARPTGASLSRSPASPTPPVLAAPPAQPRPTAVAFPRVKTAEPPNVGVVERAAPPAAIASPSIETESTNVKAEASGANVGPKSPAPVNAEPAPRPPTIARPDVPAPTRSAARETPRDDWRAQLSGLFSLFRERNGPPAPVEDRNASRQAAASRALAQSATDALARAAPVPAAAAAPLPAPAVAPLQLVTTAPLPVESAVQAPARATPAPSASPPLVAAVAPRDVPPDASQDLASQARRLLVDTVPRVAAQAEPEVSRVLSTAAIAQHPAQAGLVIEAADGPWPSESAWIPVTATAPAYARRLHNEARRALTSGSDVADVLDLELQAFAANPRDPDIAGYLALLYLRTNPARPETARQLALHSIVFSGSRRSTRYGEWSTFAVASALTGRDADAVRAFLAEATLSSNVERSCQTALRAYAAYGERLRAPVTALLQRVNAQGRAYDAPSCMWTAYWNAAARRTASN